MLMKGVIKVVLGNMIAVGLLSGAVPGVKNTSKSDLQLDSPGHVVLNGKLGLDRRANPVCRSLFPEKRAFVVEQLQNKLKKLAGTAKHRKSSSGGSPFDDFDHRLSMDPALYYYYKFEEPVP
eukprot:Lankesteria_metandrocarpae@DN4945_c0_g2_i1.p1